jgi:hypothetical protein
MGNEGIGDSQLGIAALVGGIVQDGQKLIEQQFALLRREIAGELRRMRNAAISLAIGAGACAVGGILLLVMVVHLLHTYTDLPLWGCYGVVGGALAGTGALLVLLGSRKAADVHLVPPPQTAQALKENVEWLKHPTDSRPN